MYFTKYLPVKGKIERGDTVAFNGNTNIIFTYTDKNDDGHEPLLPMDKKVKLFLCSRDIQVGDKDVYIGITKLDEAISKDECEYLKTQKAFKIIGEISPKALSYVKEGDEFDETQVIRQYLISKVAWSHLYTCKIGEEPEFEIRNENMFQYGIFDKGIQIKGPCGHFH